jgi:lipopolysaccharide transport system permease protein
VTRSDFPTGATRPIAATVDVVTVIEPTHGWAALRLHDLWLYRELLYFLVWRDVKVRYKQTAVGALWALLQPALLAVIFSIIFGHLLHIRSDGVPYPIFVYVGLLPWVLFSRALTESSTSLVTDKDLITKVYFPRLTVPLASVLAAGADFLIAALGLVPLMAWYQIVPSPSLLLLPVFTGVALIAALAVGVWLSALNVQYRDVAYTIPFLVQLWMFATPLAYSVSVVPHRFQFVYGINPIAGVIAGFRWAIFHKTPLPAPLLAASAAVMFALLLSGIAYFRRMERTFADVI